MTEAATEPITITELRVQNFMRISVVHIKPDGTVNIIAGNNGAGKTSLIDSIMALFGGGKMIPDKPIKEGEKYAEIRGTLSNGMKATRTFENGKTQLRIEQKGGRLKKPQEIFDELVGPISFDPLEFSHRMSPEKQLATLQELVGLDFTDYEAKYSKIYDERADVNREVKRLGGALDTMPHYPDISLDDPEPETQDAMDAVTDARDRADEKKRLGEKASHFEAKIAKARASIAAMEAYIISDEAAKNDAAAAYHNITVPDIEALEAAVSEVATIREKRTEKRRESETQKEYSTAMNNKEDLTLQLDTLKEERRQQITDASYPVPGLGIDDTGVIFNSIPFGQIAASEKLIVSVAIGCALHGELSLMLVRDASLLDEAGMGTLARLAAENGSQFFIERVGEEPGAIIMEDGRNIGAEIDADFKVVKE